MTFDDTRPDRGRFQVADPRRVGVANSRLRERQGRVQM
jgi:hypothetical protein